MIESNMVASKTLVKDSKLLDTKKKSYRKEKKIYNNDNKIHLNSPFPYQTKRALQ